jgi:hypothetical protein
MEEKKKALIAIVGPDGEWGEFCHDGQAFPVVCREFWTSRQRQASNLHEISYRACFKPQLPRYFIERLTKPGDTVYDPFGGRGTTAVEAALMGRLPISNDINPLSQMLARPRLEPPSIPELADRLAQIPRSTSEECDLEMFYHHDTESEIRAMREWFANRKMADRFDSVDGWLRMVATNRLSGHSPGFFSVYTLPPNQAVSAKKQQELNNRRGQKPEYRDTHKLILKKSIQLTTGISQSEAENLRIAVQGAIFLTSDARRTPEIPDASVALTVTSPPFLNVINYKEDNWLRCWFCAQDADSIGKKITASPNADSWSKAMSETLKELYRIAMPSGHVAFEVGEIRKGKMKLEEIILPLGLDAGFDPMGIIINTQVFTKTANIWGIDNNEKGTNTNRIVLFKK